MIQIKVKGQIPEKAHATDVGYDIRSAEDCEIKRHEARVVKTGMYLQIPYGYEVQIRSRSGLAAKHSVFVLNSPGTIDPDYRGEVGVILYNLGKETFKINKDDRIAQMVIGMIIDCRFTQTNNLTKTLREEGGFGSSGISTFIETEGIQ